MSGTIGLSPSACELQGQTAAYTLCLSVCLSVWWQSDPLCARLYVCWLEGHSWPAVTQCFLSTLLKVALTVSCFLWIPSRMAVAFSQANDNQDRQSNLFLFFYKFGNSVKEGPDNEDLLYKMQVRKSVRISSEPVLMHKLMSTSPDR